MERWSSFAAPALATRQQASGPTSSTQNHNTALRPRTCATGRAVLRRTATFFSIHNLGYQGLFGPQAFALTGLPQGFMDPMGPLEFHGAMNLMKAGLVLADFLGTVSPTYAREIQAGEEHGRGLQGVLRARRHELVGILNGIDTAVWNPTTDPLIAATQRPPRSQWQVGVQARSACSAPAAVRRACAALGTSADWWDRRASIAPQVSRRYCSKA